MPLFLGKRRSLAVAVRYSTCMQTILYTLSQFLRLSLSLSHATRPLSLSACCSVSCPSTLSLTPAEPASRSPHGRRGQRAPPCIAEPAWQAQPHATYMHVRVCACSPCMVREGSRTTQLPAPALPPSPCRPLNLHRGARMAGEAKGAPPASRSPHGRPSHTQEKHACVLVRVYRAY